MVWGLLAGWLACSAGALWLFVDSWRKTFDLNRKDLVVFTLLAAFGPASLLAAVFVWLAERDWGPSPVIWGRKS